MAAPYRKAKGHAWMWLVLVFASIGLMFAVGNQIPKDADPWTFAALTLPILAAIITAAILQARIDKGRRARLCGALQDLGLTALLDPPVEAKAVFFEQVAHLETGAGLRDGPVNLKWIAYGAIGGNQALVFEHEFITGSGRYTQVHAKTCVAWVGAPGWLTLIRPRVGEGRVLERTHPEIRVEDEKFDRDWIIWGDPEAATRILTQHVRESLSDSPRGECWCFGGGWSCCLFREVLDADNLLKFVARSGKIASQR